MNHNHSSMSGTKHLLLMLACCLIPIAGLLAIAVLGLSPGWLSALLPFAMVLLCPLMMIFMMRGMMSGQSTHGAQHQAINQNRGTALATRAVPEPAPAETDLRCH